MTGSLSPVPPERLSSCKKPSPDSLWPKAEDHLSAPMADQVRVKAVASWRLQEDRGREKSLLQTNEEGTRREFVFTKLLTQDAFFSVELYQSGDEQIVIKRMRSSCFNRFSLKRIIYKIFYKNPASCFQREEKIVRQLQEEPSLTKLFSMEHLPANQGIAGQGRFTVLSSHTSTRLVDELPHLHETESLQLLLQLTEGIHSLHEHGYAHNGLKIGELLVSHEGHERHLYLSHLHSAVKQTGTSPASFARALRGDYEQLKKISLLLTQKLSDDHPLKASWEDWSKSGFSEDEAKKLQSLIQATRKQLVEEERAKDNLLETMAEKVAKMDIAVSYLLKEYRNRHPNSKGISKLDFYSQTRGMNITEEYKKFFNQSIESKKREVKDTLTQMIAEIHSLERTLLRSTSPSQRPTPAGLSQTNLSIPCTRLFHCYTSPQGIFVELPNTALASGGNALVSLAYHVDRRQLVIMKKPGVISHSFFSEDLAGERIASSQLHYSPNVLTPYHITEAKPRTKLPEGGIVEEGHGILFLPLLANDLSGLIRQMGQSSASASIGNQLRAALGIAQGLAHYHEHHLLHLDISPGNVLVDANANEAPLETSKVKIFDHDTLYSLQPLLQGYDKSTLAKQISQNILGVQATPLFLAPEYKSESDDAKSFEATIQQQIDDERIAELIQLLKMRDVYSCSLVLVQLFARCSEQELENNLPTPETIKNGTWIGFSEDLSKQQKEALQIVMMAVCQGLSPAPSQRPTIHELLHTIEWALCVYELPANDQLPASDIR